MRRTGRFLLLALAAAGLLALAVGVAAALALRASGLSARPEPSALEARLARAARRFAVPAGVRALRNPVRPGPAVLAEARAHFADHCASCHGNDGGGGTELGRRLYPRAPDMRLPATQLLTDGELFDVIENGVRMTGMPGWGGDAPPEESWKLVLFIRHLPDVTPAELLEMERLNPVGPRERREREEDERFLRGDPAAPAAR